MADLERMLSLDECCALIKEKSGVTVGVEFLRRRIVGGALAGIKLGRGWRVAEKDIIAFCQPRSAAPSPTDEDRPIDYRLLIDRMNAPRGGRRRR